jgi:predicted ArsR family transcriptional regulator
MGIVPGVAELSDAKRRIVERLKRLDHATAVDLADEFGLTDAAVRQHLDALEALDLVERAPMAPNGRGRPPVAWRLTPAATELFPDRHGDLTVGLIDAIRAVHGDDGLDRVIEARTAQQRAAYRAALPGRAASVKVRVRRLAELRSAEGYLAEAMSDGDAMVLVEHHCPVCDAASVCQGLCRAELDLFRSVLGDDVEVERTQHLLSGGTRCAYRVTRR